MNRFVIVDGLPFLLSGDKTYAVRWDEQGFTVGAEVKLASVPEWTYSELSVLAKCAGHLDSMAAQEEQEAADNPDSMAAQEEQEAADNPDSMAAQEEGLDEMTVKELKAYAEERGIGIDGLTKKADILDAIKDVKME